MKSIKEKKNDKGRGSSHVAISCGDSAASSLKTNGGKRPSGLNNSFTNSDSNSNSNSNSNSSSNSEANSNKLPYDSVSPPLNLTTTSDMSMQNDPRIKYKGVCYNKPSRSYQAMIGFDGVQVCLGYFPTAQDAALAYDKKRRELYGENSATNFSDNTYNELLSKLGGVIKSNGEKKFESKTSKYRGVSYHKPSQSWQSRFYTNSKDIHLGYFQTTEEAALAYDRKAIDLLGPESAKLNFPELHACTTAVPQAATIYSNELQNSDEQTTDSNSSDFILFKVASGILVNEFSSDSLSKKKKVSRKEMNKSAKSSTLANFHNAKDVESKSNATSIDIVGVYNTSIAIKPLTKKVNKRGPEAASAENSTAIPVETKDQLIQQSNKRNRAAQ